MIHRMVLSANVFCNIPHLTEIELHLFTVMICDEVLTKYSKNYTNCVNDCEEKK